MVNEGQLSISRPTGNGEPYISIEITDCPSRARFAAVRIRLEDFTKALTGQGCMPCEVETMALDKVGLKRERKEAQAVIPASEIPQMECGKIKEWYAEYLNKNCVEEGWINDTYLNSQGSVTKDGDRVVLKFARIRYVPTAKFAPILFPFRDEE